MNATLTQQVKGTGENSKVTYDRVTQTITVPVFVSLNPDQESIDWEVDPITLPLGEWQLVWDLGVGTLGLEAHFVEEGIDLSSRPERVFLVSPATRVSATRWKATLKNEISPTSGFNGLKYIINIGWSTKSDPRISIFHPAHHDPTIAVTSEPVDG